MKIMTIFGIRPDWIKGCQVIEELDKRNLIHVIVHTGQHYSYNLDKVFFDELGIRSPDHHLEVGSGSQGEQMGRIIERSEPVIQKERPTVVLVLGDSNSSLAAITAAKLNIKVAHIESGMRAYDWRMPEEKNKRLVDHVSSYLFAYTSYQRENLVVEDIDVRKIFVTGNPTVNTIKKFRKKAAENKILGKLGVSPKEYFLVTSHRAENVDDPESLGKILKSLDLVHKKFHKRIVWPLYPRTKNNIERFRLQMPEGIIVTEPLGFLEFLKLEMEALCLITDSGTLQEEGCVLRVPCVVLRISTERPETIEIGSSVVAGVEPRDVLNAVEHMLHVPTNWSHPYGEDPAVNMADILTAHRTKSLMEEIRDEMTDHRRARCFSPYFKA